MSKGVNIQYSEETLKMFKEKGIDINQIQAISVETVVNNLKGKFNKILSKSEMLVTVTKQRKNKQGEILKDEKGNVLTTKYTKLSENKALPLPINIQEKAEICLSYLQSQQLAYNSHIVFKNDINKKPIYNVHLPEFLDAFRNDFNESVNNLFTEIEKYQKETRWQGYNANEKRFLATK